MTSNKELEEISHELEQIIGLMSARARTKRAVPVIEIKLARDLIEIAKKLRKSIESEK